MKKILQAILAKQALFNVNRHKPIIIAVTGSYGKTTTKDSIVSIIAQIIPSNEWRASEKSFNNEFGIPLTILGFPAPGRSILAWLKILFGGWLISTKKFPRILILEIGADHPGDIKFWAEALEPDIAVITGVSSVHAEFYSSIDEIAEEKFQLAKYASKAVVLNISDERVRSMAKKLNKVDIITYGENKGDISFKNLDIHCRYDDAFKPGDLLTQTIANIEINNVSVGELRLNNALGKAPVFSCLASMAVIMQLQSFSNYFGKKVFAHNVLTILSERYKTTPGRLRPLPGIKGSLIIDDSYNAAPVAMNYGLSLLGALPVANKEARRIAVLGDMAELGQYTEKEHKEIGRIAMNMADLLVFVGDNMLSAKEEVDSLGFNPDNVFWFKSSLEAGRFLDSEIRTGDIVYVKGSQSARMEKVVKDLMAEPWRAKELLVRQESAWLR